MNDFDAEVMVPVLSGRVGVMMPNPSDDEVAEALTDLSAALERLEISDPLFRLRVRCVAILGGDGILGLLMRTMTGLLPDEVKMVRRLHEDGLRKLYGLHVTLAVSPLWSEFEKTVTDFSTAPLDSDAVVSLAHEFSSSWVEEALTVVLLSSLLAWPGRLQFLSSAYSVANAAKVLDNTEMRLEHEIVERISKIGWPPLVPLSTASVLAWMRSLPGHERSFGKNRLGRALAAFSYIVSPRHQIESDVLWPLIGLEAIYCDGKENLQAQIIDKSEVYLGQCTSHKKSFKKIYQARSSFIHGALDLPMAYNNYDTSEEFSRFFDELGEARELATALLIATLQKAISDRRMDLSFQYAVSP